MTLRPDPALVERFRTDLEALTGRPPGRLGIAVSGGPDSLALLLLAAAAYPDRVEAATVDHGLREQSAAEAVAVRSACAELNVPHVTVALAWSDPPGTNLQARAREVRYRELAGWALDRRIPFLATGHHIDDQAETVLMRLARGSGVSGLAGTRPIRSLALNTDTSAQVDLVRPVLKWRRDELVKLVAAAGLTAVDDPSNRDDRFDRTRIRALLAANPWLNVGRFAAAAEHLADAEEALDWTAGDLFAARHVYHENGAVTLDASGLPRELQRRLLVQAMSVFTGRDPVPGPKVSRLLDRLRAGRGGTLAGVKAHPGPPWRLSRAPPRRS